MGVEGEIYLKCDVCFSVCACVCMRIFKCLNKTEFVCKSRL